MKLGPPTQLYVPDVPKAVVEVEPQPLEVRASANAGALVTEGPPKRLAPGNGRLGGTLEAAQQMMDVCVCVCVCVMGGGGGMDNV